MTYVFIFLIKYLFQIDIWCCSLSFLRMNPEPVALRLPNPAYEGKNVFDAADEGIELSEGDLLDRHRTALYILTQKDLPIPT